jgi:hypothetical protein
MTNVIKGRLLQALLLGACSFVANTGVAQVGKGEQRGGEGGGDGWAPVKHLAFTDEEIEGGTFAPDGTRIESVLPVAHPSLIELREGFEAEIVKTMEDM